jgi:type IV secretion system protein VirD4
MDQGWQEKHGTPPPWTSVGKRYYAAQKEREDLIANPPPVHGDARFLDLEGIKAIEREALDLNETKTVPGNAFMLLGNGFDPVAQEFGGSVVSVPPGHLLTIAATRSGKGTSHIIPNLLLYGGSTVVIDPKGENYARTYEHRRTYGRVLRIDPFRVTQAYDPVSPFSACNPMEFVEGESDARRLASVLLGDAPRGDGQFWHDEALNLLSAVILACVSTGRDQLNDVRAYLTLSNAQGGKEPSKLAQGLSMLAEKSPEIGAARRMQSFLGYADKMQSSILATINASMSIWDTPEIAEAVSRTDLPFGDLKAEVSTIYIILPFDKMNDYGAFLRLMVGQFYQAMIKGGKAEGLPVACYIDEFPALGTMKELVRALAEVAGYGVRFWIFVQSLTQLKALYPNDWHAIVSQCSTLSVFGVTDGETVDWLGKELGQQTRAVAIPNTNTGGAGRDAKGVLNVSGGASHGVQLTGTPLLSPGEIREHLGVGQPGQIIFLSGKRPVFAARIDFFSDENLKRVAGRLDNQLPLATPLDRKNTEHWVGEPKGFKYGIREANDDV